MKKTLLLFTCLLAFMAMPVLAQQKTVKKRVTFQLIKKRGADAAVVGRRKAGAGARRGWEEKKPQPHRLSPISTTVSCWLTILLPAQEQKDTKTTTWFFLTRKM